MATAVATSAMSRTWVVRLDAIMLTLSVRSFQVPETPRTWARPPSWPSVPTSRATLVTSPANAESWSTMVFRVDLSWRISPWASTMILRLRSPLATAVATWAMSRTWTVRLDAIRLTLSVRSFQTPETPRTWAWPPSLPSVPTSRATRVTSSAKPESWSTMVFTVSFSSSSSPVASTVILRLRSPLATAVVTRAMSRTCEVSRAAMALTASVTPRQVPDMPCTRARPPSLPSVPTSRATRATSLVNSDSWSHIWFTARAIRRRSPRSGRLPSCRSTRSERSPLATALSTRVVLVTGTTRSSISALTACTPVVQEPCPGLAESRSSSRPCRVTSRRTRVSSPTRCSLRSTTWLNTPASSPARPSAEWSSLVWKLPSRRPVSAARSGRSSLTRSQPSTLPSGGSGRPWASA